jgi:hypothetical protein
MRGGIYLHQHSLLRISLSSVMSLGLSVLFGAGNAGLAKYPVYRRGYDEGELGSFA